jgi:hypothetical protein
VARCICGSKQAIQGFKRFQIATSVFLRRRICTTEAEDITPRILEVEILRTPRCGRQRLDDRRALRHALCVEDVDSVDAGVEIKVPIVAAMLVFSAIFLEPP